VQGNSLSHLRIINRAARDLAGSSNYLEPAELIQNAAEGQLNFTLFALGVHDKKKEVIRYVYIQENETLLRECEISLEQKDSLTAVSANSRQTIIHNNTESLPRGRNETPCGISGESSRPESVIYLPVMSGSHLEGIISFQHNEKYAFKQSALFFLNELSPFISLALNRIADKNRIKPGSREDRHFANHDYLTGLPNKNLLDSFLNRAIPRAAREKKNMAIMFMDLDNFKLINNNAGHNTGDVILCTVAERLTESFRQSDFAARTGGDEFIMALESFTDIKDIQKIGKKIAENIRKPIRCGSNEYTVNCSMGISLYPPSTARQHRNL